MNKFNFLATANKSILETSAPVDFSIQATKVHNEHICQSHNLTLGEPSNTTYVAAPIYSTNKFMAQAIVNPANKNLTVRTVSRPVSSLKVGTTSTHTLKEHSYQLEGEFAHKNLNLSAVYSPNFTAASTAVGNNKLQVGAELIHLNQNKVNMWMIGSKVDCNNSTTVLTCSSQQNISASYSHKLTQNIIAAAELQYGIKSKHICVTAGVDANIADFHINSHIDSAGRAGFNVTKQLNDKITFTAGVEGLLDQLNFRPGVSFELSL